MSHWKQAWLVANWEFSRYFKWKDQFLGLLLFVVLSALAWGAGKLASGGRRAMTVATAGIELTSAPGSRLRFVDAPTDSAPRAELLSSGEVSGILARRVDGGFELHVEKDPRYLSELSVLLSEVVRKERLAASGLSDSQLLGILAPAGVNVRFTDPNRARVGRAEKIAAAVFLGLVMLAVLTGMAYLLTGITGEKQLRVTESITAIIRPQAWIDGKMLGIGAYSLVNILNMVVGGILLAIAAKFAWGFTVPPVVVRPGVIAVLLVFSILALLLWNAAFAAFASTIDDPNTSARSSMLFLPFIPVAMTASVLRDPDHVSSRFLAIFPLTSPTAMPMRVILSNPGLAEIALAVTLLIGTIWLFRRLAGRIFEIGMLMYGKEPTFREIWRWTSARTDTSGPVAS
jgi:ABC-2 type transport system permease protein